MHQTKRASPIDALYRISTLAGNTGRPKEALQLILNEIVATFDAGSGSIALINPDNGRLEIEVAEGLPEESSKIDLKPGQGITGWVALHGKPLLVKDVRAEARYFPLHNSVRTEMAAPMEDRGQVIGVVNLDSDSPGAFTEEDLKLLVLLTAEAGKVARNLWLIQQLQTKASQLESVLTIGSRLVSKLELQEIIDSITVEARKIVGCRLCAVFLADPGADSMTLYSVDGDSGAFRKLPPLPIDESSLGVAVRRQKQIEVLELAKTEENLAVLEAIQNESLVSLLASPMVFEGDVIGVLNVYTDHLHRFNNEEKRLFATLANLGAVAIQNARLYKRVFESEEQLRLNERLNALGLLASEVAHEIRNPLTVIKLLFQSLDLKFAPEDPRSRDHAVIEEKLDHLESIVGRVLNFAKSSDDIHSRCSLRQIVRNTLVLMRLKLEQSRVRLDYDEPEDPLTVEASSGRLEQVILNLVFNAVQAMPQGGNLNLTLQAVTHQSVSWGELTLTDTGCGIPDDIRERIFDSFLTGRQDGTGLGMAIVKRIVDSHHGTIEVVRSDASGTSIRLRLPLVPEE